MKDYTITEVITRENYPEFVKRERQKGPEHYADFKEKNPEVMPLFSANGFYETYCDDARLLCDVCDFTCRIPEHGNVFRAGFPRVALYRYLPKLVRAGIRVAICEVK